MGRKSLSSIRKQEILEHFGEVMAREGIEGASIAKIAAHMRMHPSLIIHYFKNKDEMLLALVRMHVERMLHDFQANLNRLRGFRRKRPAAGSAGLRRPRPRRSTGGRRQTALGRPTGPKATGDRRPNV